MSTMIHCWFVLFLMMCGLLKIKCNQLEEATVYLELLEMDLDDHCNNLTLVERNILFKGPNAYKMKVGISSSI